MQPAPQPPPPAPLLLRARVLHPLVLAALCALTVLHTWPLAARLRGHVAGGTEDVFMNMWHLWWMRQVLWEAPASPYFAPGLHWPLGAEMYWHTLAPAKTAWGALLLGLTTPEVAYNLVLLGTFVLSGYTAWLLARDLLARAGVSPGVAAAAAFAGACAFTFSRYHWAHARAHLNLSALEGLPLYLLCLLRYLGPGAHAGRRRWLAGTALAALYVILCDYYYFLYMALVSAVWVVAARWQEGSLLARDAWRSPLLRRAGAVALAVALACAPTLLPLLLHLKPEPIGTHHGDSDYYADLLSLVLPDPGSWWLALLPPRAAGWSWAFLRDTMAGNLEESGLFLGYLTPVLAGLALWRGVPHGRRWAFIGGMGVLLSLGTVLSIAGSRQHSPAVLLVALTAGYAAWRGWRGRAWGPDVLVLLALACVLSLRAPLTAFGHPAQVEVPMPYVVFKHVVPLFSHGGMPGRFLLLTTLALAVGVAFAAAHAGAWAERRRAGAGVLAALAVAVVPNVDLLGRDFHVVPLPRLAPVFEEIRASPFPSAVYTDHVLGQWEQTFHGQPVSFARLSRLPVREAGFEGMRLTRALHGDPWAVMGPVQPAEAEAMRAFLRENHYRWFVSHRPSAAQHAFVTGALQGTLVHRDGYAAVYRFP